MTPASQANQQPGDIYFTLTTPAPRLPHPAVRRLTTADLSLLRAAPASIRGHDSARMLAEMSAAGAVVNGRIPVWNCGEDNHASLRVAQKLRFKYDSRRTYVILEKETAL